MSGEPLVVGDLHLDPAARILRCCSERVRLTPTECRLLSLFMLHPDRVLTKERIFNDVWGYSFNGNPNIIQTYVSYLRRKTRRSRTSQLITVRGIGYVLRATPPTPPTGPRSSSRR